MVWKVLLGLAAVLALLLLCPLRLELLWREGDVRVTLRYLFLSLRLFPRPPRKAPAPPAPEKSSAGEKKSTRPRKGRVEAVLDGVGLVNDLLPQAGRGLGYILRRTTLSRCRIFLTVAREDAADTALRYGQVNAALYSAYALIASLLRVREFRLTVIPDYLHGPQAEDAGAEVTLRVRPSTLIAGALIFLFRAAGQLSRLAPARKKAPPSPAVSP